jgi:hypothetical protein
VLLFNGGGVVYPTPACSIAAFEWGGVGIIQHRRCYSARVWLIAQHCSRSAAAVLFSYGAVVGPAPLFNCGAVFGAALPRFYLLVCKPSEPQSKYHF